MSFFNDLWAGSVWKNSVWQSMFEKRGFASEDVPSREADALIKFYEATDGDNWTTNTGWGVDTTVGNWYGVTVEDGHVTELVMSNNALSDPTSVSFSGLNSLATIDFSDNSLAETPCGLILQSLDAAGSYSGTIDLSGNTAPDYGTEPNLSATGEAVVALIEKDWTLTVTGTVPDWVIDMVEWAIESGTLHIAIADGEAMFFHDTEDFSDYAAETDGTSNYLLEFEDTSGNTARAYAGDVGGGESLGSNLAPTDCCTDPDNDVDVVGDWSPVSGAVLSSVPGGDTGNALEIKASTNVPRARLILSPTSSGELYKFQAKVKEGNQNRYRFDFYYGEGTAGPGISTATSSWEIKTFYAANGSAATFQLYCWSGFLNDTILFDDVLVQKLTDIPATGINLVSDQDGTTRNMASLDEAFDPNTIVKVRFLDPNL